MTTTLAAGEMAANQYTVALVAIAFGCITTVIVALFVTNAYMHGVSQKAALAAQMVDSDASLPPGASHDSVDVQRAHREDFEEYTAAYLGVSRDEFSRIASEQFIAGLRARNPEFDASARDLEQHLVFDSPARRQAMPSDLEPTTRS